MGEPIINIDDFGRKELREDAEESRKIREAFGVAKEEQTKLLSKLWNEIVHPRGQQLSKIWKRHGIDWISDYSGLALDKNNSVGDFDILGQGAQIDFALYAEEQKWFDEKLVDEDGDWIE